VNVISRSGLKKLIGKHPEAETELLAWYKIARGAEWNSLSGVRVNFPTADLVGAVLIFNIRHNALRLITVQAWEYGRIYVKALLTHDQYDRGEWKKWA
jgi:mRNA interferase HigB